MTRSEAAEYLRQHGFELPAAELEVSLPEDATYFPDLNNYPTALPQFGTPWVRLNIRGEFYAYYDWRGSGWEKAGPGGDPV